MKGDVHVLPVRDLREHDETRECWCRPLVDQVAEVDSDVMVVHNSADGRELIERHGLQ